MKSGIGWKADIASKPANCHTAVMRMRIGWPTQAMLAAATLTACTGTKDDPHAELMKEIEQRIVLPTGALPLAKYSRYYAQDHNGHIEGMFIVDDPVWNELVRKECAMQKKAVFPCDGAGQALTAPAGASMWLRNTAELPTMSGGGCSQVSFTASAGGKDISNIQCNGDH